jgi:ankyrin repeat protein
MTAAAEGQVDVVRCLLDHGADRSIKDADGDIALTFARQNGHTKVVELLEQPPSH